MKLIVTNTFVQFLDFCRENGLDPHSRPRTVKFIQSYSDFFGVDATELICYASYKENPLYETPELWEFLMEYARSKKWKIITPRPY